MSQRSLALQKPLEKKGTTAQAAPSPASRGAAPVPALEPGEEQVRLQRSMPAGDALRALLRAALARMEQQAQGVRHDLDPEHLHELRIAVRRTRSLLGDFGQLLPSARHVALKEELKRLGSRTGPARDLDVLLADLDAAAPPEPFLRPLRDHLAERRREEQRALERALAGEEHESLLRAWRAACEPPRKTPAPGAQRPILELASRRIRRRLRRLRRDGRAALASAGVEELHALRIQGKKLRYLLESCASLYAPGPVRRAVKELKRVQSVLGRFHDAEVQEGLLRQAALELGRDVPPQTLVAIGGRIGALEHRQQRERQRFAERMRRFRSKRSRNLFRQLLSSRPAG